MPKLYTTISQWGLVSGIRQAHSDLIVVSVPRSPFAPDARKGQLFVIVEAEGDVSRGRQACELVARTIHETFYADASISITASLRQAMKAANAALYQYNFSAPPHKRAFVGATSAVIHGVDLFITQAPPSQAFVAHTSKLRALPVPLSWTAGANTSAVNRQGALGTSLGSEPEFYRSVLQVGDAVVLCSSNIAQLLGKQQAEQLICYSDAATIAEELYALCRSANLPEAHALALEVVREPAPVELEAPADAPVVADPPRQTVARWTGWLGRPRRSNAGQPPAPAKEHAPPAPAPEQSVAATEAAVAAAQRSSQATAPLMVSDMLPVADVVPLPPSAFLGEGDYGGTVRPPAAPRRNRQVDLSDNTGTPVDFAALPRKPAPPPPGRGERAMMPVRVALATLLGGLANAPRRTRRADQSQPAQGLRLKGLSYRRQRPPLPWFNILLIVGVVALLIVVGMQQNRKRDLDTVDAALDKVDAAVVAARRAPNPAAAQEQLTAAESALNGDVNALVQSGLITTTKPAIWSRYLDVRTGYDRAMASINRIGFVGDFETVAMLPGGEGLVERVVLGETAAVTDTPPLFYIDKQAGVLYQQGRSDPLLKPDMEIANVPVKPIRQALWREGNIIALDRGDVTFPIYRVYLRSGDDWLFNQLNQTEHMEPAEGDLPMATYGGHLYVWDAKEQQLWKYTSGMYADLPAQWIADAKGVALDNVVDVQVDGRVYLLKSDGSIVIFEGGQLQQQLAPPKLAVPLSTVARFVVTPDEVAEDGSIKRAGFIYLLDTRNERVLQINKQNGELIQQIQARTRGPLNQMSDLAVDEQRQMLYLANGPKVLRAQLPEPLQSDAGETTTATPEP